MPNRVNHRDRLTEMIGIRLAKRDKDRIEKLKKAWDHRYVSRRLRKAILTELEEMEKD